MDSSTSTSTTASPLSPLVNDVSVTSSPAAAPLSTPETSRLLRRVRSEDAVAAAGAVNTNSPAPSMPRTRSATTQQMPKLSFTEYLRGELFDDAFDDMESMKRERLVELLQIPYQFEKFVFFGTLVCLDVFLWLFTLLPVRFVIALVEGIGRVVGRRERMRSGRIADLLKGLLFMLSCAAVHMVDDARMYHGIRGQTTLKLYVIYNLLEDVLDSFFSKATMRSSAHATSRLRPFTHFALAFAYIVLHTLVIFSQLVTLHVAINSFSAALLTVLLSNQFVEIKSNVFKKVTRENLWQVACSDVVERFQLLLFLVLIFVRNWSEMRESFDLDHVLNYLLPQLLALFGSELIIDWLKHAFITRFNKIESSTFAIFLDLLCRDLLIQNNNAKASYDQTQAVARRLGFASIPLAVVALRVATESASAFKIDMDATMWVVLILSFLCLFVLKLLVGIVLLGAAASHCLKNDVFNPTDYKTKYEFANSIEDRFTQSKK